MIPSKNYVKAPTGKPKPKVTTLTDEQKSKTTKILPSSSAKRDLPLTGKTPRSVDINNNNNNNSTHRNGFVSQIRDIQPISFDPNQTSDDENGEITQNDINLHLEPIETDSEGEQFKRFSTHSIHSISHSMVDSSPSNNSKRPKVKIVASRFRQITPTRPRPDDKLKRSVSTGSLSTPHRTPTRSSTQKTMLTPKGTPRSNSAHLSTSTPSHSAKKAGVGLAPSLTTPSHPNPTFSTSIITNLNNSAPTPNAEIHTNNTDNPFLSSTTTTTSIPIPIPTPTPTSHFQPTNFNPPLVSNIQSNHATEKSNTALTHIHLSLLQSRLQQWCFLNAHANSVFEAQQVSAMKTLPEAWKKVQDLREEVHTMRVNIEKEKLNQHLDTMIQLQNLLNDEIGQTNTLEHLQSNYTQLGNNIASTMHRIPTSGIYAHPQTLTTSLDNISQKLESIQKHSSPYFDTLTQSSSTLSSLDNIVNQELSELERCKDLLSVLLDLHQQHTSMSAQQFEESHPISSPFTITPLSLFPTHTTTTPTTPTATFSSNTIFDFNTTTTTTTTTTKPHTSQTNTNTNTECNMSFSNSTNNTQSSPSILDTINGIHDIDISMNKKEPAG